VHVLTVNAGSSSLRLDLFRHVQGNLERLRSAHHDGATDDAPDLLGEFTDGIAIGAVAHRIVHGGHFAETRRIDAEAEREIGRMAALAPLHNPPALRCLHAVRDLLGPDIPQYAVFDTAFFRALPPAAAHYPLPPRLCRDYELRRYGFHGSAHRAMSRAWQRLRPDLPGGGRVITLQLGAGCSVTAIANGRAVDTSMGFTPLEGLMMATRCGDIDPGLLIHLQRAHRLDADALERLLTRDSGLAGVSGTSGDMRVLLASDDARAGLAIDMFCYRARKYIGAYLAALGGADAILFGGGIGEHSPEVRHRILSGLDGLGIVLDPELNGRATAGSARISADRSALAVHVIEVDEAGELAAAAIEQLQDHRGP
jgi:acetate kinase